MAQMFQDATQAPGYIDYARDGGVDMSGASLDFIREQQAQNTDNGQAMPTPGAGADVPAIDPRDLPQITPGATLNDLVSKDRQLANIDQRQLEFQDRYKKTTDQVEAQRVAAGKPLNRVLSGVQGVLGLPFRFLENVVRNENNDLTAPFKPQRTANTLAQARLNQLEETRADVLAKYEGARKTRLEMLNKALTDNRSVVNDTMRDVANAAINASYGSTGTDRAGSLRGSLAAMAQNNPLISQLGFDKIAIPEDPAQFNALVVDLVTRAGDKDTASRLDELFKPQVVPVSENGVTALVGRLPGSQRQLIMQGGGQIDPKTGQQAPGGLAPVEGRFSIPEISVGAPAPAQQQPVASIPLGIPNGNAATNAGNDGLPNRTTNSALGARPQGKSNAQLLNEAQDAIKSGADFDTVMKQLKDWGVE